MSEIKFNPEDPEDLESILGVPKTFQLDLKVKISSLRLKLFTRRTTLLNIVEEVQKTFTKEELFFLAFEKFLEKSRDDGLDTLINRFGDEMPEELKELFSKLEEDFGKRGIKTKFVEVPPGVNKEEFIKNFMQDVKKDKNNTNQSSTPEKDSNDL